MKVWVVEGGMYSDAYVAGVFATIEAVIREYPVTDEMRARRAAQMSNRGYIHSDAGWKQHDEDSWSNGCDMGDCMVATAMEVQE